MENNEEKRSNLNPDEKPAKRDIPLWLQGLEDQNQNITQPTESSELNEDNWIKEVENTSLNNDDQSSGQYSNGEQGYEAQMETNESTQGDDPDEVNTPIIDGQTKNTEKQISDEGFMDLSDFELGENMELGSPQSDEDLLSEDELPQWLMDMIDEPEVDDEPYEIKETLHHLDENEDTMEHFEVMDEPWRTSDFPEVQPASESLEITQEIPVSEYMDDEVTDSLLVNEIETEHINPISEEMTPQHDDEYLESTFSDFEDQADAGPSLIEEIIPEISETAVEALPESFSVELPKTLTFAKKLLENGEFESALDIIQSHLEETSFLEDVEKWLSVSFDESEQMSNDRLKALANVVQKRGKLLKSFAAYAQAYEGFLSNNPGEDEIN